jgi:hypothetical protein
MFGQSAVAGWLGYTVGEKLAQAFDADKETATAAGLITGTVAAGVTAVATVDPIGAVATVPLLTARAAGQLGTADGPAGSALTGGYTIWKIISSGDTSS